MYGAVMVKYSLICEKITIASNVYKCYGVSASDGEAYAKLTFDGKAAEKLVRELNEEKIELCHFKDIIDDFLAENTTTEIRFSE